MARRVRVEFPGAVYHVINRGNYRSFIFETAGARKSFRDCLEQCCVAQGWRLHAWVLMGNHYHLCVETPRGNLVEGMKWLQSTFANRFNRFRGERGHVFQGRYKAILLDADAVGPVCHYLHLNPVRAGILGCAELEKYEDSSFHHLWHARRRRPYESFRAALSAPGGLADTPAGRRLYRDYLAWLDEDETEKKRLGFESLCRGWAKGTKDFRKEVLKELKEGAGRRVTEAEAKELREVRWEKVVEDLLSRLGRSERELSLSAKGAPWKVAMARMLRERYLVPHAWIAERLQMGRVSTVQSAVSRHRRGLIKPDGSWKILQKHDTLG